MQSPPWRVAGAAGVGLLLAAAACRTNWPFAAGTVMGTPCAEYVRRVDARVAIVVRSPAEVALVAAVDGRVVVPAGTDASDAVVAAGAFATGGGYEVHALRERAGGLAFRWKATAPMSAGYFQRFMASDGALPTLPIASDRLGFPGALDAERLEVSVCAALQGPWRGVYTPILLPGPCRGSEPASVQVKMVTPWSNVVSIRETRRFTGDRNVCLDTPYRPAEDREVTWFPRAG